MHHFVQMIEQYCQTEVIEAAWSRFRKGMAQIQLFEDLVRIHNEFLDHVLFKCFIDKKDSKIRGLLDSIFGFVFKLNMIVSEFGEHIHFSDHAMKEVREIEGQFNKYLGFLYELVKQLAAKGQF